jgi:hypothetical protein
MFKKAFYLIFAVAILLNGCTMEQKLAKSFVKTKPIGQFLLLEPEYLFKSNLKTFELEGYDSIGDYLRDSLLMEKSLFLKEISDTMVIKQFVKGFRKTLELYGAEVIPVSEIDTMLINGGHPYILNIAQFSLEEFLHPYSNEQMVYDEVLVIDGFDVNAINYNVWIEIGRMNTEKKNKVLFNSDYLIDDVNGMFRQNLFTGKVIFDYTIDTITIARIDKFAGQFGTLTATLIFDYLMNTYIIENLPDDYPYEPNYYHYDPERKILYSVGEEDRIIVLDNK